MWYSFGMVSEDRNSLLNKRFAIIFAVLALLFSIGSLSFIIFSGWYGCDAGV